MQYLIPIVTALTLSILFTPITRLVALKLKITDKVTPEKIHKKETPLLGGVAVFLSFAITSLVLWKLGYLTNQKILDINIIFILISACILILGGILDDIYNLKPQLQIIFPIIAIILVLYSGVKITFVTNPLGGVFEFPAILGLVISFFWLLGMIYTTKLLDGLDGLVSGVTTIGAVIIFLVSLTWDVPYSGTSFLALTLAGASLGFLIFNFHPAKIFLGEGGSVLCGFLLGVLSIISGSKIATALLIMGVPILDVAWVILRRMFSGSKVTRGDTKHLHFRLLNIGLSHRQAVLFLYAITGFFGLTSIFLHSIGKIVALVALAGFMIFLALVLVIIYRFKENK